MNEKLKNLFVEKDKLEVLNKDLKMDMRGFYGVLDVKSEEMNKVVQELYDMVFKVILYVFQIRLLLLNGNSVDEFCYKKVNCLIF